MSNESPASEPTPESAPQSPEPQNPEPMGHNELRREILRLALPAGLQNLLMVFQFFIDTKMVGHYAGEDPGPLAALGISGPLVWSTTVVASFTSVAATALVARRIGESNPRAARSVTATACAIATLLGVLVAVVGVVSANAVIDLLMGLREESIDPAVQSGASGYLFWVLLLFPARSLAITLAACFRGAGDSARPLWAGIFGNVINVLGNMVFIFGMLGAPALGAAGAGLATGLAGVAEFLLLGVFLLWNAGPLQGPKREFFRVSGQWARALCHIGWPALLDALIFHIGFVVYQLAVFQLAEVSIAAHRVAITLQSLAFMPAAGFYASAASMTGRFLGRGDPALAGRAALLNLRYGLIAMAPVVVLFLVWARDLAALVADAPDVWPAAAVAIRIGAIEIPFLLCTEALRGALRGAGETRSPLVVAAIGTWLVRVPFAWILSGAIGLGLSGIWLATVIDWILRSLGMVYLFRRGRWREVRV